MSTRPDPLPRAFFARDADEVARDLVGKSLVHGDTSGRIVETEAYFGTPEHNAHLAARDDLPKRLREALARYGDPASHAGRRMTPRNEPMWGPAGISYVYILHGHACLNVTTGEDGEPQAVLLRAAELPDAPAKTASGPGRLTRTFGVTKAHDRVPLTTPPLYLGEVVPHEDLERPPRLGRGPRVNVSGAEWYPFRFADLSSDAVSKGPALKRMRRRADAT